MALGQNVKIRREAAKLTQTQLAEMAEMDQQALAALEKRDSKSSSFAPALARALGVPLSELLGVQEAGKKASAVPFETRLITPEEISELVRLYGEASTDGRRQILLGARAAEKAELLRTAASDQAK